MWFLKIKKNIYFNLKMGLAKKVFLFLLIISGLIISYILSILEYADVITLPLETNARCLDGSLYHFQITSGYDKGVDKFIIFFEGGAWCGIKDNSTIYENCYHRSFSMLGKSSYFFSKSVIMPTVQNIFSNNPKVNRMYHNWNKVLLRYCDGTGYVSNIKDPINYNGRDLYFRGYQNVIESLSYLVKHHNIHNADQILISGTSAGGLASMYWANHIQDFILSRRNKNLLPPRIHSFPDSGFFLDVFKKQRNVYHFREVWNGILEFLKTSSKVEEYFTSKYCSFSGKELYKCFLPEYFLANIKVPVFILNPLYDLWVILKHLGEKCVLNSQLMENCNKESKQMLENGRHKMIEIIRNSKAIKTDIGAWLPSSISHGFLQTSSILQDQNYSINGKTLYDALVDFTSKDKYEIYNGDTWNPDTPLSNLKDLYYYLEYYELTKYIIGDIL
jgi:hypothetical protein